MLLPPNLPEPGRIQRAGRLEEATGSSGGSTSGERCEQFMFVYKYESSVWGPAIEHRSSRCSCEARGNPWATRAMASQVYTGGAHSSA